MKISAERKLDLKWAKPNKDKEKWTSARVAQDRPNIMARVDGTMYMAVVDSVNPDNNTAMIRYSPQAGVRITYQTRLTSVIGALNAGQALYHVCKGHHNHSE